MRGAGATCLLIRLIDAYFAWMNGVGGMQAADVSSRQLRAVIALARHRSFVEAAAFLGVSQPALSRALQRLERSLGTTLFRRSTRAVSLTAAGRDFLPTAERLLGDLDRHLGHMRELADQRRGYVVVACLMSLAHHMLPAATAAYRRRFPGSTSICGQACRMRSSPTCAGRWPTSGSATWAG